MVLLENKKTPVKKPRILLRLDKNKRFKPSRLIFLADFVFSVENLCKFQISGNEHCKGITIFKIFTRTIPSSFIYNDYI
jgi:hypothetical protein